MTKETAYRLWFTILMAGAILLAARSAVGQPPPEGSMGKFPLPAIVGMTGKADEPPVQIDVNPKVALLGSRTTFRVQIRLADDERNRRYSYAADCGAESKSSQGTADFITSTRFEVMTIAEKCFFQACVYRVEEGKVKMYCASQEVITTEKPP